VGQADGARRPERPRGKRCGDSVEGDTLTQNAYNAWDLNLCSPLLANAVADWIGALVDRYYGQHRQRSSTS
jgi:hypothetical protein